MENKNESQKATSGQNGLVQVPQENGIKRCGYCDALVRWTSQGGSNVAVNGDGSRHMCLTDGTAKRRDPVKHDRPAPAEVSAFLRVGVGSAAGPVNGAGGNVQTIAPQQSLPNHQRQAAPAGQGQGQGTHVPAPATDRDDRDAAIRAVHEANIAAWKAQTEATNRLADAMIEAARSTDVLAKHAGDLVASSYRLADEVARLTHLLRGIVAKREVTTA